MAFDSPICLQPTPYGGRGFFARRSIPKDTLLLSCSEPYAAVISKKFRKEVCAHCFAYAFESRRNAWNIRLDLERVSDAGSSCAPSSFASCSPGVWFCTAACRDAWEREHNAHGLLGALYAALDRLARVAAAPTKKPKALPVRPFLDGDAIKPEDVTPELVDAAWTAAEEMYDTCTRSKSSVGSRNGGRATPVLEEYELDMARFVASAIVRRYLEDAPSPLSHNTDANANVHPELTWSALLRLQNNELPHLRTRPHMLDSHRRIYGFLRHAICGAAAPSFPSTSTKPGLRALEPYIRTSETVRAVLVRDQGNAFGIWDNATEGDHEMLGWCMYTSASFFNHDCSPNVRKRRSARAMQFFASRDVAAGEELCISYVDPNDSVSERRSDLLRSWFFECTCRRCGEQLLTATNPSDAPFDKSNESLPN